MSTTVLSGSGPVGASPCLPGARKNTAVGCVVGLHSLEGSLQPWHLVILLSHHAMLQERGKLS